MNPTLKLAPTNNRLRQPLADEDDGLITIDRDSINENPAAKFVPPAHDDVGGDFRPSQLSSSEPGKASDSDLPTDFNARRPETVEPMIELDQRNDRRPNREAPSGSLTRSPARNQPARNRPALPAEKPAPAIDVQHIRPVKNKKRRTLLRRIADQDMKSLVSRTQFRGQALEDYSVSRVAGETTVYGMAYLSNSSLKGFDFMLSRTNPTIEFVVPSDQPQFEDSQHGSQRSYSLIGINIYRQDIGILGVQGIFGGDTGEREVGPWVGTPPPDDEKISIRPAPGKQPIGFVVYRNGMRTVGLGLVVKDAN